MYVFSVLNTVLMSNFLKLVYLLIYLEIKNRIQCTVEMNEHADQCNYFLYSYFMGAQEIPRMM